MLSKPTKTVKVDEFDDISMLSSDLLTRGSSIVQEQRMELSCRKLSEKSPNSALCLVSSSVVNM